MRLGLGLDYSRVADSASPPPFTAVAADGWQATVTSPVDLSYLTASVSRAGYDTTATATSYTDTILLTKRVRQAYPSQASFTAATWNGSAMVSGAGGGTYTLQSGSTAKNIMPAPLLSHDLAGNSRGTGTQNAGAYQ